jgi:hypothetical protein
MIFCSAVARNFLPHAQVLAQSLAAHHPGARLELFVVDESYNGTGAGEPFRRLSHGEAGLSLQEWQRRRTMYEVQALVSSLKPRLLAAVVARANAPAVFIDADMQVFAALDDIDRLADRFGIVLTPHSCVAWPFKPGGLGPEQAFLMAGACNGGFVAVSPAVADFLRWWDERCARDCVVASDRGLTLSQGWLTLVPSLFDHHVLRDRGVNLSGHGMGADDLDWRDERPWIGDTAVRLFHFGGGFDPHSGELRGPQSPYWWPSTADRPGLARLCRDYARRLLEAGFDHRPAVDADGPDAHMRFTYRMALIEAEERGAPEPPNPFAHGRHAFNAWLFAPAWEGGRISRYLAGLRQSRTDLLAAFPHVPGADEDAYLNWLATNFAGRLTLW